MVMNQEIFSPEIHRNSVIFDYKLMNLQGYVKLSIASQILSFQHKVTLLLGVVLQYWNEEESEVTW